jgi:hypothetical protein
MELLFKTSEQVTLNTVTMQHPTEGVLVYTEWVNDQGRIMDCEIRSKDGHLIEESEDHFLVSEVYQFVDSLK